MKSLKLLLLVPTLVLTFSPEFKTLSAESDLNLSESITNNLTTKLQSGIELNNEITFFYQSNFTSLRIIDQIDSNARTNIISFKNTILQELYLQKDNNGNTIESYLSVSNTVETREITDSNGNSINFDSEFGSPLKGLSNLTNAQINSYFDVTQENGNYVLLANSLGYGILSNSLLSFYSDFDYLVWDTSVVKSIENLKLTLDNEGNPINLNFDKIKKDIFGGIKENYDITISSIENVSSLTPKSSLLTEEQKNTFINNMSTFQSLINKGNFTHNIALTPQGSEEGFIYSNYYELDANESELSQGMICSLPLEDATYGETYVGMFNTGSTFSSVGISPDEDYSGTIKDFGTTDISEVVPQISDISADYFSYNENTNLYTFDFNTFIYADTYFSGTILISLFGLVDPCVHNLGIYIYDGSSYYFDSLTIGFDDNGYPYGTLTYYYYGYLITSNFNFTNIGTTDLESQEDISKAVNYLLW